MKRIFYYLASAIVALGAVACQNDIDEQINGVEGNDVVTFNVAFDETRIAVDMGETSASFTFEDGDKLYVKAGNGDTYYEFSNTADNLNQFSCRSAALVAELESCNYNAYISSRESGIHDSSLAGMEGLLFYTGTANLNPENTEAVKLTLDGAVFHFTVPANTEVILSAGEHKAFYTNGAYCTSVTYTAGEADVEYFVQADANTYTLSYSVDGEDVKSVEKKWAKNTIYNLGTLTGAVATVNGVKYTDLQKAINAADGATVTLGQDVVVAEYLDIPASANVTLDLNGNNITTTSENKYVLSNEQGGTVTINGNGGSMTGRIYNTGGKMVINGGTFNTIVGDAYTLMNSTDGELTVTDATVNGGSGFYGICGYNANNEVILNNVNVTGTFGALCSYGEGAKMTVNGGTYEMTGIEGITSHIAYFSTESTIVINDGTFRKIGEISLSGEGGGGICVAGGADLTINGGNFAGDYSDVYNWGSEGTTITIKGGTYKFNPTASFIAAGYKVTENANGTFTVAMTPVAALNKQIADGATNITISESFAMEADDDRIVIPAGKEVTVTLEEGVEITGTFAESGSDALFNIAQGGTLNIGGEGSIVLVSVKGDVSNYGQYIFENCGGTLNITGGTYNIEASGSGSASWYIPTILNNNSTLGETVTTISGGYFYSTSCINIMRQFINNSTYNATINITGGEFEGLNADKTYGIWNQNSGGSGKGYINISGTAVMNNVFVENETDAANVVVSGGTFGYEPGVVNGYYNKLTIAEGYFAINKGNGTYIVQKLEASDWGIVGGFNSWADDVTMYKTSTDNLFVAYGVEIKEVSGQENGFKIRKNGAWGDSGNYGTLTTVNGATKKVDTAIGVYTDGGSGNITVAYGTYDIYFDRLNSRVYVMTVGKEIAEATQQTTTTKYSFAGSVSGWDDSTPMVYAGDGIWTISRTFKAGEEWKVKNHGNWNASWGYDNVWPDNSLVSNSGGNAKTKAAGDYIVGFVASINKITFVKK